MGPRKSLPVPHVTLVLGFLGDGYPWILKKYEGLT